MAYGTLAADTIQSSTANTPVQFNDGNGTQVGTLCRAWVNFNGVTTATIRASFNVSSVTRNGTGDYTINFTNAMVDANYTPVFGATNNSSGTGRDQNMGIKNNSSPTTTSFRVQVFEPNTGNVDALYGLISVFR